MTIVRAALIAYFLLAALALPSFANERVAYREVGSAQNQVTISQDINTDTKTNTVTTCVTARSCNTVSH